MKLSKFKYMALAAMAAVPVLQSCSDDEQYDVVGNKDNLVYVDMRKSNVTETTLYRTPIGVYGETTANVPVCVLYAVEGSDITVSANADTTLVSGYNSSHSTSYLSVPDDVLRSVAITPAQIDKGSKSASANLTVEIPQSVRTSLTGSDYVLPVRLSIADGKGDADRKLVESKTNSAAYMVMHMSQDLAYVSGNTTATTSVVNTPVGVFGGIEGTFDIALHNAVAGDVKVSAEIDNSLVNTYNTDNNTSYKALPADVANKLVIEGGTVAAGETATTLKVSADKDLAANLKDKGYVVPLRITMTYSDGTIVKADKSLAYLVLTIEESSINSKPSSIIGEPQYDCSGWECISAKGFKASAMTTSGWNVDGSRIESGSFTIDLKDTHNIGAFSCSGYVVSSVRVYLSTDGTTWTDLGSTSGKGTVRDDNWNNWYVLYGSMPARYVKFDLSFDTSSWAWNYPQWGYCSIDWGVSFDD